MEKYAILLGYIDKQMPIIENLYTEVIPLDVAIYDKRYVFALKVQQLFTALEDLLKQVAKTFENCIDDLGRYHKELLLRLHTPVPNIRPAVISKEAFLLLDKLRSFRHFIRHAYDCELDDDELKALQNLLQKGFSCVCNDIDLFRHFIEDLIK